MKEPNTGYVLSYGTLARNPKAWGLCTDISVKHVPKQIKKTARTSSTHGWTLKLDAPMEFVEGFKIILDPSYSKPIRILTERPYELSAEGHTNFTMLIEVLLKDKFKMTKAIMLHYDLTLETGNWSNYTIGLPTDNWVNQQSVNPLQVVQVDMETEDSDTIDENFEDTLHTPTVEEEESAAFNTFEEDSEDFPQSPMEQEEESATTSHESGSEKNKEKHKRIRKQNACFFCHRLFKKIGEHMIKAHSSEKEVEEIEHLKTQNLPRKEYIKERRRLTSALVGQANYRHNRLIKAKNGSPDQFIVRYCRPNAVKSELAPCAYCKHLMSATSIHRHKCPKKYKEIMQARRPGEKIPIIKLSRCNWMQEEHKDISKQLAMLLSGLRNDEISETIKKDQWLIQYANETLQGVAGDDDTDSECDTDEENDEAEFRNNDFDTNTEERLNRLRQSLRDMGKYLIQFRLVSKDPKIELVDTFKPAYKKFLSNVVKNYSCNYTTPHALDSLRRSLVKLLKTFMNNPGEEEDKMLETTKIRKTYYKNFCYNWNKLIQPKITSSKLRKNLKKKIDIPSNEEIGKFNIYVNNEMNKCIKAGIKTYPDYLLLCKLTHCRITTLNFRRSGEVARMSVDQFENRTKSSGKNLSGLTQTEKTCAKFMEVVTLKGKSSQNEVVVAILPPNCVKAIHKLLEFRNACENLKQNPYVFGTRGSKNFHIIGSKSMRTIVTKSGIKEVAKFTATCLRKYIATEMLWRNISVPQRKLLASHMGHLLATHENIYTENVRTDRSLFHRIPAMLMNVEAGNVTKKLSDLTDQDVADYIQRSFESESDSTTPNSQRS